MSDNKSSFGEQNWSDVNLGSNNSGEKSSKDSFLRLNPGSNIIRILTLPYAYYQHKYMPEGGAGRQWGYRIACSDPIHRTDCPVCEKGDKAKRKWFLGVIDRKTGQYKVLDIGYSVFKDLQVYSNDSDWGVPHNPDSGYDVDLVVNPEGGPQGYYKAVPKPRKKLSPADMMILEQIDLEDLKRRSTPPDRAKVQAQFDKILEEIGSEGTIEGNASEPDASGDDDFFKNYTKK